MRQISIRTLKAKLSAELKDLPFAVTNNGRIVGFMLADCSHIDKDVVTHSNAKVVTPEDCSHIENAKTKLTKIVNKKADNLKSTASIDETFTFGFPKSHQCRKKIK